jgi:carboxymethylenebutenolidase
MNVRTEMIVIDTPGGAMPAQLARPESAGPLAAVVVVQEAFGLNDHIKDVAARIAAEGYVTLAPDLYHRDGIGRTASYDDLGTAIEMMTALTDDAIVQDVGAAFTWLRARPDVRAGGVGITGFCMGGRVAYLAACAFPEQVKVAVPFYGGGIPVERTETLAAPVLAIFGGDDSFIPAADVQRLDEEAKRLGKPVEIVVYPGAPHGFFCNERDSYRAEAAADAWEKLTGFLAAHLAV